MYKRIYCAAAAALGLLLMAGCASLSPDEANTVRARVKELLARPLGVQDAVQIALLNNRVALQTRKAWFAAVAAQEAEKYMEQVNESAEAGAELARRMVAVGNWPKLNQAREQAFYAETTAQLARARHARLVARERLTRQMGLWGEDTAYRLPERLPELPQAPREAGDLEARAQARSEVREAYSAYRTAFDLARHYRDEIVPLRKRISEEMLLRYNGMLASVFELLADSRESVASVSGYIDALRGFWIAESDLQMALAGRRP